MSLRRATDDRISRRPLGIPGAGEATPCAPKEESFEGIGSLELERRRALSSQIGT
jgi:hypothetical protein